MERTLTIEDLLQRLRERKKDCEDKYKRAIQKHRKEMGKIRRFEQEIQTMMGANAVSPNSQTQGQNQQSRSPMKRYKTPLRAMVLEILQLSGGLTAKEILELCQEKFHEEVPISSISAILSRLRADEFVENKNMRWFLKSPLKESPSTSKSFGGEEGLGDAL